MDEAFRTGDFSHRHGGGKGVAAGNPVGDFELVGAKADPIGAVAEASIKSRCRRFDAAGYCHRAVALFDPDNVERRIGKDLGDAQLSGWR